jgi:magnesium-protoporphyrin O-methyltransferase
MDSLIYYGTQDITDALHRLGARTDQAVIFTVAPKTAFLMTFWTLGKAFPRADRSPIMVPHAYATLHRASGGKLAKVDRVSRGFYISECLEYRP